MSDLPKILVMVATPTKFYGKESLHFTQFIKDLQALSIDPDCPYEFIWSTIDMGVVPARNKLVANCRKLGCKWLAFVDYDMEALEGETLAGHLIHLLGKKLPIIAGMYTTREDKCHWAGNFLYEAEPQKGTVLQVIEWGTGMKIYHTEVFDNLEKLHPQLAYTDRDTGEKLFGFFQHAVIVHDLQAAGDLLPEDYFCDFLCRMCRISVWVDTAVKLKHRGPDGKLYPLGDWPPIPTQL